MIKSKEVIKFAECETCYLFLFFVCVIQSNYNKQNNNIIMLKSKVINLCNSRLVVLHVLIQ